MKWGRSLSNYLGVSLRSDLGVQGYSSNYGFSSN